jgi:hypothetical protein
MKAKHPREGLTKNLSVKQPTESHNIKDVKKQLRIPFFKLVFCWLLEGTFTSFFKDKKLKRSHKTVEIKVFLLFVLHDRRIRIRIQEAQKHVDPSPDPQYW